MAKPGTLIFLANQTAPQDVALTINSDKPKIKGSELALSSDTNDGNQLCLYAADHGLDHQNDGRVFEIDLGPDWLIT